MSLVSQPDSLPKILTGSVSASFHRVVHSAVGACMPSHSG